MSLCATLRPVQRQYVQFDPCNAEHVAAAKMLCLGSNSKQGAVLRQHDTLRFELEQPFTDVRTMLIHKIIEKHVELVSGAHDAVTAPARGSSHRLVTSK